MPDLLSEELISRYHKVAWGELYLATAANKSCFKMRDEDVCMVKNERGLIYYTSAEAFLEDVILAEMSPEEYEAYRYVLTF